MKTETKIIIFLLFLSPALGELLTGSSPPIEFFNPVGLIFLVLLYGCGTLLIREAKVRWDLQWSVIFLAIAYGILEEGAMIQSFFNTAHADLDNLSGYGLYLGVQWPWAIMLTFFHATISTLIPIAIAQRLWPEYKNKVLLKKKGIILTFTGLIFVVAFWMIMLVGQKPDVAYINYHPDGILIISSIVAVFLLIWLAYRYKDSRISTNKVALSSPFVFAAVGFLFQGFNVFCPFIFAGVQVPGILSVIVQLTFVASVLVFVVYQIHHQNITERHIASLIFGSIFLWILLTPVLELNGIFGMSVVGIITLIFLIIWMRIVLRN